MFPRFLLAFFLLFAAPGFAQPVTPEALRRHIEMLASDAFEGREPGTEGERKTIDYIAAQLAALGLEGAGPDKSWFQPLDIEVRRPLDQKAVFVGRRKRDRLSFGGDRLLLLGRAPRERLVSAPIVFAGHGAVIPGKGIDQLAGGKLEGAVVLILYEGPDVPGFPSYAQRVQAVTERGAAAVVGIIGDELPWPIIHRMYEGGQNRLGISPMAPIQGAMSQAAAGVLMRAAGTDLRTLLDSAPGPGFKPVPLKLRASLEVATEVRRFTTRNVVGRLRGRGRSGEAILYLGHWDHLGLCAPEGAPDRICNGAVDNASGIAVMIEVARALAAGPRPNRDILFLATTAEEMGLLGAEYFAQRPPVPLASILAAINLDTVAIAPKGQKVAVMGRGHEALDSAIDRTIAEAGRTLDTDDEAAAFLERQDGWALVKAGVPAVMVGGSFSDMAELGRFLRGPYHQPDDDPGPHLVLEGAAEDADLLIRLGRRLADPAAYAPKRP